MLSTKGWGRQVETVKGSTSAVEDRGSLHTFFFFFFLLLKESLWVVFRHLNDECTNAMPSYSGLHTHHITFILCGSGYSDRHHNRTLSHLALAASPFNERIDSVVRDFLPAQSCDGNSLSQTQPSASRCCKVQKKIWPCLAGSRPQRSEIKLKFKKTRLRLPARQLQRLLNPSDLSHVFSRQGEAESV